MPDEFHNTEIGLLHNNRPLFLLCFGFAYFTISFKLVEITFHRLYCNLFGECFVLINN